MKTLILEYSRRMARYSVVPVSIGLIYLWFGALKFFSGVSPAEALAKNTIDQLTAGLLMPETSIFLLAIWETLIGVLLIFNLFYRIALKLAFVHIIFTFSPFLFFPELIWTEIPFGLTLLGQYIVKNIVILGILLVLLWKDKLEQTDK